MGAGRQHHRDHERAHRATVAWLVALTALAGCQDDLGELDTIFYDGDARAVHCAVNLDTAARLEIENYDRALDRAAARGEIVELYAHRPGVSLTMERLEHVLAGARDRGLAFFTYADLAARPTGPGIALSFDDTAVVTWDAARELLDRYGARVTFFASSYATWTLEEHGLLHGLAADGHEIAAHTVHHLDGPQYVEQHGLAAYLRDEVQPSIDVLADEGFDVRSFAYPHGARTDEIDGALDHLVLRSVEFGYSGVVSPCPN